MPLKKSAGNMYPWVTHTHSHLIGKCPHGCSYCYVQAMGKQFKSGKYAGPLALDEAEFGVKYGQGRIIFMEHMNDLFAEAVPTEWIHRVLNHCSVYPANIYVFQTKNPVRVTNFVDRLPSTYKFMVGTTLETTKCVEGCNAPQPAERAGAMCGLRRLYPAATLFVTIEPILKLDVPLMLRWLDWIRPTFVNIGADSKGTGLVEPTADEVRELIAGVQALGIEIRQKHNLNRLLGER